MSVVILCLTLFRADVVLFVAMDGMVYGNGNGPVDGTVVVGVKVRFSFVAKEKIMSNMVAKAKALF